MLVESRLNIICALYYIYTTHCGTPIYNTLIHAQHKRDKVVKSKTATCAACIICVQNPRETIGRTITNRFTTSYSRYMY